MNAPTAPKRKPRSWVAIDALVRYWSKNYHDTFPNLPAALIGWGEPFCFRCGWLAPEPSVEITQATPWGYTPGSWGYATGWLEKAHLQDHWSGGEDEPANIVPLCALCHRGMPDFPNSRDNAIAWVADQNHNSCPTWWQVRTDARWNRDSWTKFPGRLDFINFYVTCVEQQERNDAALRAAKAGNLNLALRNLKLAGIPEESARRLLQKFVADSAREQAISV